MRGAWFCHSDNPEQKAAALWLCCSCVKLVFDAKVLPSCAA